MPPEDHGNREVYLVADKDHSDAPLALHGRRPPDNLSVPGHYGKPTARRAGKGEGRHKAQVKRQMARISRRNTAPEPPFGKMAEDQVAKRNSSPSPESTPSNPGIPQNNQKGIKPSASRSRVYL